MPQYSDLTDDEVLHVAEEYDEQRAKPNKISTLNRDVEIFPRQMSPHTTLKQNL